MNNVPSGEFADLIARAHALEHRVIQLQRTIDHLRTETQACIAARERELDLLAACETNEDAGGASPARVCMTSPEC